MKRRDFLKSAWIISQARSCRLPRSGRRQKLTRSETLPDRLRRRPEQSRHPWHRHQRARLECGFLNCYDRLISHEMKNGPRRPLLRPRQVQGELAREDMNIGDMSGTFKLKKNAKSRRRRAGYSEGRQVVARSRGLRRRFPDFPDECGLAD